MADSSITSTGSLVNTTANGDFSLLSGSINFTGLGSGTDFNEIVDQLVAIESINKQRLETWRTSWQAKIDSMTALNQRLGSIEEGAAAMDTAEEFLVRGAASSSTSVLTASASNTAVTGAYRVTVGSDTKQILRAAGLASTGSTAVSAAGGDLVLRVGATDYTVTLAGGETLEELKDAINAQAGGAVTASITDDGTTSRPQHLTLTAVTGGDDGRVSVALNPTLLSLDDKGVALAGSTLGVDVAAVGQFTGDKADGGVASYSFTVQNVAGGGVVGTDSFELSWTRSWDGGAASAPTVITVPADYTPGDSIAVEEGVFIQLDAGAVTNGETFSLNAYANDIDDAETATWSGPNITTSGNYLGSVNKTYTFAVVTAGAIADGGGADTVVLRWTDSTGLTGTVSISDSAQTYGVDQGVEIKLDAGALTNGDTFQVNVFAPVQQQGQDKGLAQGAKAVHSGFGDKDTSAVTDSEATFSYTYGGQTVSLTISAGETLYDLATDINSDADNPGVTASIINDGLGLPNSYKLVLTGKKTGAQYQITNINHTFTGTSFGSGGDLGGGFTSTQLSTSSQIKVDGFPTDSDLYLQRSSNLVQDVITGISLALIDAGEAVVSVATNVDSVITQVEALVNAVNYAQDYIRDQTRYDSDAGEAGILIGNYTYYIIKSRIDSALNASVSGLVDGVNTFTHISQIGIHTDPDDDGRWVIDETMLRNALNSDADAVANLFVNNTTKGTQGVAGRLNDEADALTDSKTGALNVLIKNYTGIISNIDNKIDNEEKRLELYRQRQVERFARLEATLATLNGVSSQLESQIDQLPGINSNK
ncbi:MAG: flagellar filament capping protein FliD [Pseudomonadota bacterium]